jgi:tellurite resistance protein TerC
MLSNLHEVIVFGFFLLFIALMLAIDLGVFSRKSHKISFREALIWTCVWVAISIAFYFLIRFYGNWFHDADTPDAIQVLIDKYRHPISIAGMEKDAAISAYNRNLALEYLTGYLIEYSLSVDNIFVIIMIFLSFNIRQEYYKRVLLWGILGAIVMRFIFIFVASALIQRFEYFLLVFAAILVIIGIRMVYEFITKKDEDVIDTENHPVVRFTARFLKFTRENHGERFWIRKNGKLLFTPLFLVLLIIEFSDVLFAVDSVPAVFSVTQDPFIVFFSNVFAILGLRSLFFLVMGVMNQFRWLKAGLGVLLTFVGVKMAIHFLGIDIPTRTSLIVIVGILATSVIISLAEQYLKRLRSC